jgi:hypothetical protein
MVFMPHLETDVMRSVDFTSPHLALLIAAPQPGETAMYCDQVAMAEALLGRGFAADDILCLHGRLDRPLVQEDAQAGRLPPFYRPHFAAPGDADRRLPDARQRAGADN